MGVPPPPGSTCGPVGASELASRFGSMEATAEIETEHAATVLGTIRLDHLPKTNLAELGPPRESASCKTAFAVTSPACRAAGSGRSIAPGMLKRPGASEGSAARRGPPRCALRPRKSRRGHRSRWAWWIRGPWRSRRTSPSSDDRTAARSWGGAPSAIARTSCRSCVPIVRTLSTARGGDEGDEEDQFVRELPANCRGPSPVAASSRCSAPARERSAACHEY
jgi:hypothetical protein